MKEKACGMGEKSPYWKAEFVLIRILGFKWYKAIKLDKEMNDYIEHQVVGQVGDAYGSMEDKRFIK